MDVSDEQQTGTGQITCVEAVAIRIVRAGPEVGHSPSTIDRSLVEAAAIERQTDPEASRANGQGSQAIEVEQSRFPMTPESAVWNGEVKAPSPEEALCCLCPAIMAGSASEFSVAF